MQSHSEHLRLIIVLLKLFLKHFCFFQQAVLCDLQRIQSSENIVCMKRCPWSGAMLRNYQKMLVCLSVARLEMNRNVMLVKGSLQFLQNIRKAWGDVLVLFLFLVRAFLFCFSIKAMFGQTHILKSLLMCRFTFSLPSSLVGTFSVWWFQVLKTLSSCCRVWCQLKSRILSVWGVSCTHPPSDFRLPLCVHVYCLAKKAKQLSFTSSWVKLMQWSTLLM